MLARRLLIVSSLMAVGGCSKPSPAPTPIQVTARTPALPAIVLANPGRVSLDQAVASLGQGASFRFSLRTPQLAEAGLVEMLVSLIPADARASYEQFKSDSGFDVETMLVGGYMFGEIVEDDIAFGDGGFVLDLTGATVEQLLGASRTMLKLERDEKERKERGETSEDDDGDFDLGMMLILIDLSADDRAALVNDTSSWVVSDQQAYEVEALENGNVFVIVGEERLEYGYVWSGGLVGGSGPRTSEPPLLAAKRRLAPVVADLARASSTPARTSENAIEGQVRVDGRRIGFFGRIAERLKTRVEVTLLPSDIGFVTAFMDNLPAARAQPQQMLGGFEPNQRPIAAFAFSGTDFKLSGDNLVIVTDVDAEAFKDLLSPLL